MSEASKVKKTSLKHFLRNDVHKRIMAVNNKYKSEYERVRQRDALIELVDIVHTRNGGECFTNRYFDTVKGKLEERAAEEDKAREEIYKEEMNELNKARNSAQIRAKNIANSYLEDLQLETLEAERQRSFTEVMETIKGKIKELKEGIPTLLKLSTDSTPCNILMDIINEEMMKALKNRVADLNNQVIDDETKRKNEFKREKQKQQDKYKEREEEIKYKPLQWFALKKEKEAEMRKYETEEENKIKEYDETVNEFMDIRKYIIEKESSIIEEKRESIKQLIENKGSTISHCEIAGTYTKQAAILISQSLFQTMDFTSLKEGYRNHFKEFRNKVEAKVIAHLQEMEENLGKMMLYDATLDISHAGNTPMEKIIDEAFNTQSLSMMTELTGKTHGSLRMEHRGKSLKEAMQDREKNPIVQKVTLGQYEIATNYVKQWAMFKAEELMGMIKEEEIQANLNDLTAELRPGTEDLQEISSENITTDVSQTEQAGNAEDENTKVSTDAQCEDTSQVSAAKDLLAKLENSLTTMLQISNADEETLKCLSNMKTLNQKPLLTSLVEDSLLEAMFMKAIEVEKTPVGKIPKLPKNRKSYKLERIMKAEDLRAHQEQNETAEYERAKLYTTFATEFLTERYLKHVRVVNIKKEDNDIFKPAMDCVEKTVRDELAKEDNATLVYFERYTTPQGKLSPLEKISRTAVQTTGRWMIILLEDNLDSDIQRHKMAHEWEKDIEREREYHRNHIWEIVNTLVFHYPGLRD